MINLGKYGRILKCVILIVCTCLFFYYIINNNVEKRKELKQKTILYWTPMFQNLNFSLGLGDEMFKQCEYRNCYATYNRTYLQLDDFDALIFHGAEIIRNIPKIRNHQQIYIVSISESPIYTTSHLKKFNQFFNWTMTYRHDSDIIRPYGVIKKQKTNYQLPSIDDINRRTKQIAWFVSHCNTESHRERIVNNLKKSLHIDIYGRCGNESYCPRNSREDCMRKLELDYKFYLAFENSYCKEYVTEKLYNTLKYNLVPIVYGGGDYNRITPPNSVINIADYRTLDDFIDYIRYLDKHPYEYLKYFRWKTDYIIDTSEDSAICSLCKKLNQPIQRKSYTITDWWYNNSLCTFPDNIVDFIEKIN